VLEVDEELLDLTVRRSLTAEDVFTRPQLLLLLLHPLVVKPQLAQPLRH
jgi:hypothetical protein